MVLLLARDLLDCVWRVWAVVTCIFAKNVPSYVYGAFTRAITGIQLDRVDGWHTILRSMITRYVWRYHSLVVT